MPNMNAMATLYRNANSMNGASGAGTNFTPQQNELNALQMQMLNDAQAPVAQAPSTAYPRQGQAVQTVPFNGPGGMQGEPRTVAARPYVAQPMNAAPIGYGSPPPAVAPSPTATISPGIGSGGLPTTQLQAGPGAAAPAPRGPMGFSMPRMPFAGGMPADAPPAPGVFPAAPGPRVPSLVPPWRRAQERAGRGSAY